MKRLGVIGTMVWDTIHGRDARAAPVEEWGGIAYALAALAARLPPGWQILPLIKVGRDLVERANAFLQALPHVAPGSRFIEVPEPNNRVTLRYDAAERRCERLTGGVPPWTWPELGPMVADLDALYVNFIAGFEMQLATARALRHAFGGEIYADLHSLFLGVLPDGVRVLQPLPDALEWFRCFDTVQLNEAELAEVTSDPLALAAAGAGGTRRIVVTLGPRGAVYVETPPGGGAVRTARVPAPAVPPGDPTGCGDVFGATLACELLRGVPLHDAVATANQVAARNVGYRGATGLHRHLRGQLLTA